MLQGCVKAGSSLNGWNESFGLIQYPVCDGFNDRRCPPRADRAPIGKLS